jgi:hypothetical protein
MPVNRIDRLGGIEIPAGEEGCMEDTEIRSSVLMMDDLAVPYQEESSQ